MKEVTVKVYSFSELSKEVQAKLIEKERYAEYKEYFSCKEIFESFKAFMSHMDIDVKDWSIDYSNANRSYIKLGWPRLEFDADMMHGIRLWKYLMNNYSTIVPKYSKDNKPESIIDSCCPFTGVCFDHDVMEPFINFLKRPDKSTDFNELMEDCVNACLKAIENAYEYENSDEYIREGLDDSYMEYLEDGTRF